MCLEGLRLDYLTAVAAHHQVEVVLRGTLAKYGHVCRSSRDGRSQDEVNKLGQHLLSAPAGSKPSPL